MDGTETNRRNCAKTEQQKMLDSGGNQSGSKDRVTLKKEIGLLSACAIIIGEMFSLIDVQTRALWCFIFVAITSFNFFVSITGSFLHDIQIHLSREFRKE